MGVSITESHDGESGTWEPLPAFLAFAVGDDWEELTPDVRVPLAFLIQIETKSVWCHMAARLNTQRRPECESLDLRRLDGGTIDWKYLREVPIDAILRKGLRLVTKVRLEAGGPWVDLGFLPASPWRDERLEALPVARRAGGRRTVDRSVLERVASIYLAAESKPIHALREHYAHNAESTIKKWVAQARKEGLLPPATYKRKASDAS